MADIPNTLALTSIEDGSDIVASEHRNNYSAIQTALNALLGAFDDGSAGKVLHGTSTTLTWDYPPGYRFARKEITSPVSVTATTEAGATTLIGPTEAVTFDGSTEVVVRAFAPGGANTDVTFVLLDGSTVIGQAPLVVGSSYGPLMIEAYTTPSSGSHTFTLKAFQTSVNGTFYAGAGGSGNTLKAFLEIRKA